MKKTAIILSAIITGAMSIPFAASAKNNYPTFPPRLSDEELDALTDEEKAARSAQFKAAKEELARSYKNGEYDWDFNLDGITDFNDSYVLLIRYTEFSTSTESRKLTPIQRAKIDEESDINGDGITSADDSAWMMQTFSIVHEKGDINMDGKLDARDASKILTYYSEQSVNIASDYATEINMEYLGDVNGDQKINSSDASCVLKEYSKRATE